MIDPGKIAVNARKQLGGLDLSSLARLTRTAPDVRRAGRREQTTSQNGFLGGFVLGALLGALIGVAIALLLAPRRGDDTRTMVSASASEMRSRVTEIVHQVRSEGAPIGVAPRREFASEPAIERTYGG